jgi:hypothetical protein
VKLFIHYTYLTNSILIPDPTTHRRDFAVN